MSETFIYNYLKEIENILKQGEDKEHTYRVSFIQLIKNLFPVEVLNEPKRQECGEPDILVKKRNVKLGYIEAKGILEDLDNLDEREVIQRDKYLKSLNNLIYSNYVDFIFYVNGQEHTRVSIAEINDSNHINPLPDNFKFLFDNLKLFCQRHHNIKSAEELANLMAIEAQYIRKQILNIVEENQEDNFLVRQRDTFKTVLMHSLSNEKFADMYAQTIVYGLFVARLNAKDIDCFSKDNAKNFLLNGSPFLTGFFKFLGTQDDLDNSISIYIDDLVEIYKNLKVDEILSQTKYDRNLTDPFVHFYEEFLDKYDKDVKKDLGVFYTKIPIVKYIVNAVDEILKKDFNLSEGLADNTKTNDKHRVQILDPATGTGTFLIEVIKKIFEVYKSNFGMWSNYVEEDLIPRLNAFEIMMTPYIIAHLKYELTLGDTGYKPIKNKSKYGIYLTNSLETYTDGQYNMLSEWLPNEAKAAGIIKNNTPVMVVLGNPPYKGESANGNLFHKELEEYKKEPNSTEKIPDTKWVNNDYVKFIRMAQMYINKNNSGIVAYINANSYLNSQTFRGMRHSLLETYDKIYVLNLHGDPTKLDKSLNDENVFDIQEAVCINIFIKTNKKSHNELAKVYYKDVFGSRKSKYEFLNIHTLETSDFKLITPKPPLYQFADGNYKYEEEYNNYIDINSLFSNVGETGICSKKDFSNKSKTKLLTMQYDKNCIKELLEDFIKLSEKELKNKYLIEETGGDWNFKNAINNIKTYGIDDKYIQEVLYRPFDYRYTYFTDKSKGFIARPVYKTMQNFIIGNNYGLIVNKSTKKDTIRAFFITNKITDSKILQTKDASAYIFPLFKYTNSPLLGYTKSSNLDINIIKNLKEKIEMDFSDDKINDSMFSSLDVLDYVYANLYSDKYFNRYKKLLQNGFPKIPYPKNKNYFIEMVKLGKQLRLLHTLDNNTIESLLEENQITYPKEGNNIILKKKIRYENQNVIINDSGQYFANISEKVWNMQIGDYYPAKLWLEKRNNKILNNSEIKHYIKMLVSLSKTIEIIEKIDKIIEL